MNKNFEEIAAFFIFPHPFPKEDRKSGIYLIVSKCVTNEDKTAMCGSIKKKPVSTYRKIYTTMWFCQSKGNSSKMIG
jgi:hypothetical protein